MISTVRPLYRGSLSYNICPMPSILSPAPGNEQSRDRYDHRVPGHPDATPSTKAPALRVSAMQQEAGKVLAKGCMEALSLASVRGQGNDYKCWGGMSSQNSL